MSETPASSGIRTVGELAPVGRAARWACEGGGELWRVPADAARAAARLVELGTRGAGGFVAGGVDGDGPWLARAPAAPTLAEWLRRLDGPRVTDQSGAAVPAAPVAWPRAVAMMASLAAAADACEQAALFPGAIEPDAIVVRDDDRLELRAEPLVAAIVGGAAHASTGATAGTRWMAPEQGGGRAADNASNRYAIGLVLYRLLAGEHPFAGAGLRRGMVEQAERGAPPLPPAIADGLPPGLQALCLRLLDPDAGKRPASARAIADELRLIGPRASDLGPRASAGSELAAIEPAPAPRVGDPEIRNPRPAARIARPALAILVGAGACAGGWLLATVRRPDAGASVAPAAPLAAARTLADCASCHPRESAEWTRSVMAHAIASPLFESQEMLIEEQIGRDLDCPDGAGVLRDAGAGACRDRRTGLPITGAGGARWCVNCHAPADNLRPSMPPWSAFDAGSRRPARELLSAAAAEGVSCAACHQTVGPAHPGDAARGLYEGNPSWRDPDTGITFAARPEDERGQFGIANSGYALDPAALIARAGDPPDALVPGGAHRRVPASTRAYLASSEFCGACHDVRLFGTDALGVARGEHFKRLRNGYSEWRAWADDERAAGRTPATCQGCHMSLYPGVCASRPGAKGDGACPDGTAFSPREPGAQAPGGAAHYFSGVDVPLAPGFDPAAIDDDTLDVDGVPVGARRRRDLLLRRALTLAIDPPRHDGSRLAIPIVVENVGAGHRVPAGFSQERELWVHVRVTDAAGAVVYESGAVRGPDDDLHDKTFVLVNVSDQERDRGGRPLGLFGADVADGPDVPQWTPTQDGAFVGRGLINFQNGFLRCVRCIGAIDADGTCRAAPGQEGRRADRFADGDYDPSTGECRSNLTGAAALLEIYFPIGALDAARGVVRGPDAIIDTRSLAPHRPARFVVDVDDHDARGPFTVTAELRFRAFPPYLLRAFVDYERDQARQGRRPGGPLIDERALARLDVVTIATARAEIP